MKQILKRALRSLDLRLVRTPSGRVTGFELPDDLRVLITTPTPLCFDVGANMGQTIALLQRTFPQPTIHSFEPSHRTFEQLRAREFGDRVFLHNCAMGSRPERRSFINYKQSDMSSFLSLDQSTENRFRTVEVEGREEVEVATLDDFVKENGIGSVDLLKTDTQGFDLNVLRGGAEALSSGLVKNVLVELNFVRMYEGQGSPTDIAELLHGYGFRLVDHYEKNRRGHMLAWCTGLFTRS
jgi:FkbM family methyltransferase